LIVQSKRYRIPATVGIFFWSVLSPAGILEIQVAEDKALLESNPSAAACYTGSGRLIPALFSE
jgi:hypothetical protein